MAERFPGPTIRRPAGHRTEVTFHHELPRSAGELTVHLHGGHNRSQFDGQPGGLTPSHARSFYCDIPQGLSPRQSGNDLLLGPGGKRTYVYDLTEEGRPERAAFQWYHDHRLDHTARNIWRGLAGMWIVDDEFEARLPLPRGARDLAADDRRPLLRPRQPAHRSVHRTAALPPTGSRLTTSSSTAPTCRTIASLPSATACASSTSRSSAPTTSTSPTARR